MKSFVAILALVALAAGEKTFFHKFSPSIFNQNMV